jgi:hypothetical protein
MTNASIAIIEKFGGVVKMARAMGHKHPTTVQGWKAKGIPSRRFEEILRVAEVNHINIKPKDFIAHLKPKAGARGKTGSSDSPT